MTKMEGEIPEVLPCASCGGKSQRLDSTRPEGRMAEVYRVACACGSTPAMWAVSKSAAVRLWNRYMSETKGRKR